MFLARSLRIHDSTMRESHPRISESFKFHQTFIKCLPETSGLPRHCKYQQLKGAPAREFWRIVWKEGFAQKEWRVVGGEERELARGQTDFSGLGVLPLIDTASQSGVENDGFGNGMLTLS